MNQADQIRAEAYASHTVPCIWCGAKPNQPCINKATGKELDHFLAHQCRINEAKKKPPDDDEVPF